MTFVFAFSAASGMAGGHLSLSFFNAAENMSDTMSDTLRSKSDMEKSKADIRKPKSDIAHSGKHSLPDKVKAGTLKTDSVSSRHLVMQPDSVHPGSIIVTDSIPADSVTGDSVKSKNALDAPVVYEAKDSMVYDATNKMTRLFGSSQVTYQDMNLDAEVISMNMDSSVVHAEGVKDSTNQWMGLPLFKQGNETYESERMSYNFKTRKGFIQNVTTEQGEGFMYSESSKRTDDGTIFSEHATYTT